MMNNKELEFFEGVPDQKIEDVCASEDSPIQRSLVGCKPLVIKVSPKSAESVPTTAPRVVIKTPAPFPYADSKQVPWRYNCEVSEPGEADRTKENVNEVGNFTRSGSEFNMVEQLNRLPARISMLSLLLSSELHRNALLKMLNQTFAPKEILVDKVDRLVGNIAMDNFLSFSDEEIPEGGRGSRKSLHIMTRCKGYMLPGVLVDNESALNILPLSMLKKLPIDSTHMKPYQNTVRAFDGTQREVIGKIEVPLMIGPSEYEVDFVVMDIKPTYSCLLG
ncbi:hypothetical protein V6N11_082076 [Hibiscus sabdariffa]|uniref:Uncharacterized protein n=1 Tax=Hibiscus sabdariffa TaxID=183260 RepID=A0ABR2QGZ3_9ROSI